MCDFVLVVCKLEGHGVFSAKSGGDVISDDFKMAEKELVSSNFTNSSWFQVKKIWS